MVKSNNFSLLYYIYFSYPTAYTRYFGGNISADEKNCVSRSLYDTIMAVVYSLWRAFCAQYSSLITGPLSQIFSLDFTCMQNYMGAVTREAYSRMANRDAAEDPLVYVCYRKYTLFYNYS